MAQPWTLLGRLNEFPPRLCRAMALTNRGHQAMSHKEVAEKAGLSKERIIRLSKLEKWDTVPIGEAQRYARACGLQLHRLRSDVYLRMRRFKAFLPRLNAEQRRMYARL